MVFLVLVILPTENVIFKNVCIDIWIHIWIHSPNSSLKYRAHASIARWGGGLHWDLSLAGERKLQTWAWTASRQDTVLMCTHIDALFQCFLHAGQTENQNHTRIYPPWCTAKGGTDQQKGKCDLLTDEDAKQIHTNWYLSEYGCDI